MFSELSIQLTKSLETQIKKDNGIYFTPNNIVKNLIHQSLDYLNNDRINLNVLEPSCGSGEFISGLLSKIEESRIDAIELNSEIYDRITNWDGWKQNTNQINWFQKNFLDFIPDKNQKYDLIVGNPPYVVIKKSQVPTEYFKFLSGRPNLFCLFIIHSLKLLKPNGILSFIIPKSFLNSGYYSKVRELICQKHKVLEIINYPETKFLETKQEIFGLIVQNRQDLEPDLNPYIFRKNILTSNKEQLTILFKDSTSLKDLGFRVLTGNIVWNQNKDKLSNEKTNENYLLIYNSNISVDNQFNLVDFKTPSKGQYIKTTNSSKINQPVIVVNRGNGNAKYKFHYALINQDESFYVENHLNVIYPPEGLEKNQQLDFLGKIIESFKNPMTTEFTQEYLGNNGLSKNELFSTLPIYLKYID